MDRRPAGKVAQPGRHRRSTHCALEPVNARLRQPTARASCSIDATSSGVRAMVRAFQFSSRCAGELVPGIGSMTGERASSHAIAICAGDAPWRCAAASSAGCGRPSAPLPSGKNGRNAMPLRLAQREHRVGRVDLGVRHLRERRRARRRR